MHERRACLRSYNGASRQGEFGRVEHRHTSALGDLKSITSGSSPLQGQLAGQGQKMLGQTAPIRSEAMKQLLQSMQGGRNAARVPMIQQAVSQSNQATSMAMKQTAEGLAQRNIGGPFAASALAQLRQRGQQETSQIPTQMGQQTVSQYLPFAGATQQLGMGAFTTAAQSQQQLMEYNASNRQQSALAGGGGILGIICLSPDCPVDCYEGSCPAGEIEPGDVVWSRNKEGEPVQALVLQTQKVFAGPRHVMVRVEGETTTFLVSPNHPDQHGRPISERFSATSFLDGEWTCDIRVASETGIYFVDGVPLRSTM